LKDPGSGRVPVAGGEAELGNERDRILLGNDLRSSVRQRIATQSVLRYRRISVSECANGGGWAEDTQMSAENVAGGGEERKGTRVTFLDQTGAKSVEAVIADTVSVKRILPNIITKMNLPVMGPDGQPMSYSLDHKEGGKRLREDQTLPDAAVTDGHHLVVYPEIVAG